MKKKKVLLVDDRNIVREIGGKGTVAKPLRREALIDVMRKTLE